MKKLLLLAIVVLGLSAISFGQLSNNATANASASVFTALTIDKKADLSFGALGAKTTVTTAIMRTDGTRGGTADLMATNPGQPATFEVKGDASNPFTITFPSNDITLTSGSNTMTINKDDFIANIDDQGDSNSGTIKVGGISSVKVGATLQVKASQAKGDYTGAFSVTVNYN